MFKYIRVYIYEVNKNRTRKKFFFLSFNIRLDPYKLLLKAWPVSGPVEHFPHEKNAPLKMYQS